jgi:hypothetical protein
LRRPAGRWRRRQSEPERTGAFEAINITPFTDVLLVLLITFMIAGSAMAPSGMNLTALAAPGEADATTAPADPELVLEIEESGEAELLYQGAPFSWERVGELPGSTRVMLSPRASSGAERVIGQYERLLQAGLSNVEWGPPRPLEQPSSR